MNTELEVCQRAAFISDGACNPVAVANALAAMIKFLRDQNLSHGDIERHPAIQATLDQLCVIIFGSNHPATAFDGLDTYAKLDEKLDELNKVSIPS